MSQGIAKICNKLKSHDGFLSYVPARKDSQPSPSGSNCFALSWSALKKPSCEHNFLHISEIPSSSRHKICCQILERLFVVFQQSKSIPCNVIKRTEALGLTDSETPYLAMTEI